MSIRFDIYKDFEWLAVDVSDAAAVCLTTCAAILTPDQGSAKLSAMPDIYMKYADLVHSLLGVRAFKTRNVLVCHQGSAGH